MGLIVETTGWGWIDHGIFSELGVQMTLTDEGISHFAESGNTHWATMPNGRYYHVALNDRDHEWGVMEVSEEEEWD